MINVGFILIAAVCAQLWNMDELSKTPSVRPVPSMSEDGVRAIMIDGPAWNGLKTSAFAYYALPDAASATNRAPGIVLVHGGLGTAYLRWVKLWRDRGYAAIAVDNCGGWPVKGEGSDWLRHRLSGPPGWGGFDTLDRPLADQWFYHAVAVSILSHSFLRAQPEVDTRAIGVTGISWGGILTCAIAGVDRRFAYAAPVYGCGYLKDHSSLLAEHADVKARWHELWDPSQYLPLVKCPFLWVDGTNDFAFPLDSVRKSAALVKDSAFTTIVRMPHSHGAPGEDPAEILAFADHYARGGRDIVRITSARTENGQFTVRFNANGRKLAKAEFVWTTEGKPDWKDRYYNDRAVEGFQPETGVVTSTVPADAKLWYVSLVTDDGLRFSSPVEGPALKEYP